MGDALRVVFPQWVQLRNPGCQVCVKSVRKWHSEPSVRLVLNKKKFVITQKVPLPPTVKCRVESCSPGGQSQQKILGNMWIVDVGDGLGESDDELVTGTQQWPWSRAPSGSRREGTAGDPQVDLVSPVCGEVADLFSTRQSRGSTSRGGQAPNIHYYCYILSQSVFLNTTPVRNYLL